MATRPTKAKPDAAVPPAAVGVTPPPPSPIETTGTGYAERRAAYDANERLSQLFAPRFVLDSLELFHAPEPSLDDLKQMIHRGTPVRLALDFLSRSAAARVDSYSHPDPGIEAWVKAELWPAITAAAPSIIGATVAFGTSLSEPRYSADETGLHLRQYAVADPLLWWQTGMPERDPDGRVCVWRLLSGKQAQFFGADGVRRVIHWTYGSLFDNAWGDGCLYRAFGHWYTLRQLIPAEAMGAQWAAIKRLILLTTSEGQDLKEKEAEAIAGLSGGGVVAFPKSSINSKDDVIPIESDFKNGSPFENTILFHFKAVLWSFGIPPLLLMEALFGTRAQSGTHSDAYSKHETEIATSFAKEVVLEQMIKPALQLQFGPRVPLGEVHVAPAEQPDPDIMQKAVTALTNGEWLSPEDPEHRNQVGAALGFDLGDWTPKSVPPVVDGVLTGQTPAVPAGDGQPPRPAPPMPPGGAK